MKGYALRASARGKQTPISRNEFEAAREERRHVRRLLHEETLFDQLATNVTDWLAAMVRAAARFDGSVSNWAETGDQNEMILRIANVLTAAMAFTENVEKDSRHKRHKCGTPMCTIARELRNRLQHGMVEGQPVAGGTNVRIDSPQMSDMPVNRNRHMVTLTTRWRDIQDAISDRNPKRERDRSEKFRLACEREFPNLDRIDVVVAVFGHLRCLSSVMNGERKNAANLDGFVKNHSLLLQRAKPLRSAGLMAVSPEGVEIYLRGTTRMLERIKELRHYNDRLPATELVQFGGGSPTQGSLSALLKHIEHMLEATGAKDITLAAARGLFHLEIGKPGTEQERLIKETRRLYETAQDASARLRESSVQLRQIESALAKGLATEEPKTRESGGK